MVDEATGGIAELLKFFSNESAVFGDIQPSWARANASRAELLRGDLDSAAGHLDHIPQAVMEASRGPVQNAVCCGAYAAFAVEKARAASAAGRLDRRACRECLNALRRDLRNGRKFAPDRTEAWKLAGNYYWFAGSRRRRPRLLATIDPRWRTPARQGGAVAYSNGCGEASRGDAAGI